MIKDFIQRYLPSILLALGIVIVFVTCSVAINYLILGLVIHAFEIPITATIFQAITITVVRLVYFGILDYNPSPSKRGIK